MEQKTPLRPIIPQAPPTTAAQKLLLRKGKTTPTWESILQTVEALIAAFEEMQSNKTKGVVIPPSAPAKKVAAKK